MTDMLVRIRKPLGWLLILVSAGPIGLSFGLIANPSLGGFVFVGIFATILATGIWLIRRDKEEKHNA